MKNEHPAFFPPNRTILQITDTMRYVAIELQFYRPDSDRLRVGSVTD